MQAEEIIYIVGMYTKINGFKNYNVHFNIKETTILIFGNLKTYKLFDRVYFNQINYILTNLKFKDILGLM